MEQPKIPTKGGVVAYLCVEGAQKASEFYQKAFSDPYPEHGCGYEPAKGFSLMFPVQDVDGWHKRAVEAGATSLMPPTDMFWGDRYAQAKDPFGVTWAFVGPKSTA